jgi:hypothetical protein
MPPRTHPRSIAPAGLLQCETNGETDSALDWRKDICKVLDNWGRPKPLSYRLGSKLRINLFLRRSDQKDARASTPAKTA